MVCGLMFIIHQRDGPQGQCASRENLRIRVVANCKVEVSSTPPTRKPERPLHQVSRFSRELTAAMPADNFSGETDGLGKFDRFRKVSSGNDYFMITSNKLVCERAEERHVR